VTQQSLKPTHSSSRSSSKTGVIAGGAIGGTIFLALVTVIALVLLKRRRARSTRRNDVTESVGMVYPSGYARVNVQDSPPRSSQPELSAYPTESGVATSAEPSPRPGTRMMTAPINEDEEYYNRVVGRGQATSSYIPANRPVGFTAIPEVD